MDIPIFDRNLDSIQKKLVVVLFISLLFGLVEFWYSHWFLSFLSYLGSCIILLMALGFADKYPRRGRNFIATAHLPLVVSRLRIACAIRYLYPQVVDLMIGSALLASALALNIPTFGSSNQIGFFFGAIF